jgi:fatty acid desaturase
MKQDRLHALLPRYAADWRTLCLLAVLTVLFAWSFMVKVPLLTLPLMVLCLTACVAKHNHTHCATFRSRIMNRVLDLWLTLLTGTSTTSIRIPHQVRHHGRNQSPDDFVRVSLVHKMPAWQALLSYVPLVICETWKWNAHDLNAKRRPALWRAQRQERLLLWAFILTGLALDARQFLLTFVPPWLAAQWFLIAVNLPQHDGCDSSNAHEQSHNVVGRFSNWLFLNNGYHSAHHGRPSLHWSLLPKYHETHLRVPREHCAASLGGLWVRWWRYRTS